MKILVAHNYYQSHSPSGENRVVEQEVELLEARGIDVVLMTADSDSLTAGSVRSLASAAISSVHSFAAVSRLKTLLECEKPDVMHVHNVYPLLSPSIINVAKARSVPVVQTVHNYRHTCVAGTHFRAGATCTECIDSSRLSAVRHRCYRDSVPGTIMMTAGSFVHQKTWRSVDAFITLSPYMADLVLLRGVDPARVWQRPTAAEANPFRGAKRRSEFLFVGRLDESKGVRQLLGAWKEAGLPEEFTLRIVGSGPLSDEISRHSNLTGNVRFTGSAAPSEVQQLMASSLAVVIPSRWWEGFPRVLAEACAAGTPVICSAIGSLKSVVDDSIGWFAKSNALDLADVLRLVARSPKLIEEKAENSYSYWDDELRLDISTERLISVYNSVVGAGRPS